LICVHKPPLAQLVRASSLYLEGPTFESWRVDKNMIKKISEIKKEMEIKLSELRMKRKNVITKFKKKLEEAKIEQIRNSILEK